MHVDVFWGCWLRDACTTRTPRYEGGGRIGRDQHKKSRRGVLHPAASTMDVALPTNALCNHAKQHSRPSRRRMQRRCSRGVGASLHRRLVLLPHSWAVANSVTVWFLSEGGLQGGGDEQMLWVGVGVGVAATVGFCCCCCCCGRWLSRACVSPLSGPCGQGRLNASLEVSRSLQSDVIHILI